MSNCAGSAEAARPLFQVEGGGSIPTSALHLHFEDVGKQCCKLAIKRWHRTRPRLGAINTMKACFGAVYDGELFAVAAWSNPVARMLPQREWLELRRFAIRDDSPKNTASRMIGWMVRELFRRYPEVETLISYQDKEHHGGTIYRAAGWSPVECHTKGGAWSNRERCNRTAVRADYKIRWEKRRRVNQAGIPQ